MTLEGLRVVRAFSIAELRAIKSADARTLEVILWPSRDRYLFDPGDSAVDNGDLVVKPDDLTVDQRGRWKR